MAKLMNLRQLELFAAVVERGSITRTAEALHISQPAVSARLHALEQELGEKLFMQVGRQLVLTAAGHELYQHTERIMQAVDEAELALADLRSLERGTLRVAASSTFGCYVLPTLLASFQRSHPSLRLAVELHNQQQVLELLRHGQVDIALTSLDHQAADLVSEPFAQHQLIAVAPPQHPLAQLRRITAKRFATERMVLRENGSGLRSAVQAWFEARGLQPQVALELRQNAAIKQAVMAGLGVAGLSTYECTAELASGALVRLPVDGLPLNQDWFIVMRREGPLSHAAEAFCQLLRVPDHETAYADAESLQGVV